MKRLLYITAWILLTAVLSCCSTANVEQQLDTAESLIAERPDSSLVILDGIAIDDIGSRRLRAKYALLLTQAKDKNYIDETDATLIREAKDYYDNTDDIRYRFMSCYYYGRVLSNAGDYTHAIIAYTQAEELLNKLNDNYLAGLLYTEMGCIYLANFDYIKCLAAYKSAYRHYKEAELTSHAAYAMLDIGIAYWNIAEDLLADELIHKAINMALSLEDDYLERICYENLIILYNSTGNVERCGNVVRILTEKYDKSLYSAKCLGAIANYYADINQSTNAERFLLNAWDKAYNEADSLSLFFQSANIMKRLGRVNEALSHFENGALIQNEQILTATQQPIVSAQKEYFHNQSKLKSYQLKKNTQIYIILFVIAMLCIVVIAMHAKQRILLKDIEISKYIDLAAELQTSIQERDNELSDIITQTEANNSHLCEMSNHISELFHKQYELLDKLSKAYYETHGISRDKDRIYEEVRHEINKFANEEKSISELEIIVNRYKRNVLNLARTEIPNLSNRDIKLLCFIYAGFSAKSISIFTGETIGNVLTRKYRLRNKISKANTPNAQIILEEMP